MDVGVDYHIHLKSSVWNSEEESEPSKPKKAYLFPPFSFPPFFSLNHHPHPNQRPQAIQRMGEF